jgi:hypothetical protein
MQTTYQLEVAVLQQHVEHIHVTSGRSCMQAGPVVDLQGNNTSISGLGVLPFAASKILELLQHEPRTKTPPRSVMVE